MIHDVVLLLGALLALLVGGAVLAVEASAVMGIGL
jgi:hypothetical protein